MSKRCDWFLIFVCCFSVSFVSSSIAAEDEEYDDEQHDARAERLTVRLTPAQREAAGIVSTVLKLQSVANVVHAPGEIHLNAYATTKVTPRIAAQVLQRHVKLGDHVTTGQALLTLSSVDMAQAQGDLLVADHEWQRVKKLGPEIVAGRRYTQARVSREQALARVRAYGMTKRQVAKLLGSGNAELADGRFQLLASQDGTVIRDDFIIGELVEAGRILYEISDESVLWVEAKLTPDRAVDIEIGAIATVLVGDQRVEGRVVQVHHALDEDTRRLGARIEIPNPGDKLHPGTFVGVDIAGPSVEQVLAVPTEALVRSPDGDWMLFVEHEPNVFEAEEVDLVRSTGNVTVIEGLEPGTQLVTQGAFFIQSELAKGGFDVHGH